MNLEGFFGFCSLYHNNVQELLSSLLLVSYFSSFTMTSMIGFTLMCFFQSATILIFNPICIGACVKGFSVSPLEEAIPALFSSCSVREIMSGSHAGMKGPAGNTGHTGSVKGQAAACGASQKSKCRRVG